MNARPKFLFLRRFYENPGHRQSSSFSIWTTDKVVIGETELNMFFKVIIYLAY